MNQEIHPVGQHYLIEFDRCDVPSINSEELLREGMLRAVDLSGAKIIKEVFHSFSPHGVTGVVVIAESHVSIHTWPEFAYAAVDIFTCSSAMEVQVVIDELKKLTGAGHYRLKQVSRGPEPTLRVCADIPRPS